jgi:hypothetical protein
VEEVDPNFHARISAKNSVTNITYSREFPTPSTIDAIGAWGTGTSILEPCKI